MRVRWVHLCDNTTSKKTIWQEIGARMQSEFNYDLGKDPGAKCSQKWKNLQKKMKEYAIKCQQTGSGADVLEGKPDFYDEIMEIMGGETI